MVTKLLESYSILFPLFHWHCSFNNYFELKRKFIDKNVPLVFCFAAKVGGKLNKITPI